MTVDFLNSKTRENLMRAFAGESQARNRYTIAAAKAREQKMQAIAEIFSFTAKQERAHAEVYYGLLKEAAGQNIEIGGGYPVDLSESLTDLLRAAEHNETEEYEEVYRKFGDTAKEEGFRPAASAFYQIAEIERVHAERFGCVRRLLESGTWFEPAGGGVWMCLNCGHIHEGKKAPAACPVCHHDRGYFIPLELAPYLQCK